jgi:hypothetical protein
MTASRRILAPHAFCWRYDRFEPDDPFWGDVADDATLITKLVDSCRSPGPRRESLAAGRAAGRVTGRLDQTAHQLRVALFGSPTKLAEAK